MKEDSSFFVVGGSLFLSFCLEIFLLLFFVFSSRVHLPSLATQKHPEPLFFSLEISENNKKPQKTHSSSLSSSVSLSSPVRSSRKTIPHRLPRPEKTSFAVDMSSSEKPLISLNNEVKSDSETNGLSQEAQTHGPIAIFSPYPEIPSSLQEMAFHHSVILHFFISSTGQSHVSLLLSSGHEELDSIALAKAKQWLFKPAKKNAEPIESQIKVKMIFRVK